MSFRIPFRVGVIEYPDLYPSRFRDFWNACLDGSTGNLRHPEFGEMDAKVSSFTLSITPERRDGYDVDVEFVETTENNITVADNPLGPIAEAISVADAIKDSAAELTPKPEYEDGSGVDLLQALKQLEGMLFLAQLSVQAMINSVNNVIGAVNGMIDTVNQATDPKAWGVVDGLKSIEASLQEVKDSLAPNQKKIDFIIAQQDIAVRDASGAAGMKIADFLKLNPALARTGLIPMGKEYFVQVGD